MGGQLTPEYTIIKPEETTIERIARLIGIDVQQCPCCKKGQLVLVATLPRIRPPPVQVLLATMK